MIGRLVLAALIAGMAAGLIMAGIQYVRLTPLIAAAEVYEKAAAAAATQSTSGTTAKCVETMPGMTMCNGDEPQWEPQDGLQRTLLTTLASVIAGAGFAVVLAGISLLTGIAVTPRNGLIWGLCGFLAVTIATGAGLPPELPGMPVAELLPRQTWWFGTIVATGIGLYLIATRHALAWLALAVFLIALPHVIGAPQPASHETAVPAGLAAQFVANTVAAAAVFWSLIGLFLGLALQKFGKDVYAS